jgi:hypothetical protein
LCQRSLAGTTATISSALADCLDALVTQGAVVNRDLA